MRLGAVNFSLFFHVNMGGKYSQMVNNCDNGAYSYTIPSRIILDFQWHITPNGQRRIISSSIHSFLKYPNREEKIISFKMFTHLTIIILNPDLL